MHRGSKVERILYEALVCLFLVRLLSACVRELNSGQCELPKIKLCRRVAKLDTKGKGLSTMDGATQLFRK
ncbi:hypothetical protein BJX63DRAFT_386131 [Aspergillus granulosus]|uniref:Secreted protein n=1 Tax=Aspergillus granulosus TaxID=176169 RepID=A0ABR4HNQ1_9EURO